MKHCPSPRLSLLDRGSSLGPRALRGLLVALLVCGSLAAFAAPASAAGAVDAFYERLYDRGLFAERLGDTAEAARLYEIACFGMLEAPSRLAACLTHLSLTEAALDRKAEALDAARRLLEVERRFQVFDEAPLEAGQRTELIALFSDLVPYALLDGLPAFRDAARSQEMRQIRALEIDERRRELDRRQAQEPRDWAWRLLWAELELEDGQYPKAANFADLVLELRPGLSAARCIRGKARAADGLCSEATIDDLAACSAEDLLSTRARLACWTGMSRWREALDTLDELPAEERDSREMQRTRRDLEERLERDASAKPPPESPDTSFDVSENPPSPSERRAP